MCACYHYSLSLAHRSSHFPKQKTLPNIRGHATTDDQSRLPSKQQTVEAFATLRNTARHHPYEDAEVATCACHCKNKLVVLTTEWLPVAYKLKKQWLCIIMNWLF